MLNASGIRFSYGEEQSFDFPSITCQQGKPLLILGESGKGKTTLLHLLGGILKAQSGSIVVGETDLCSLSTQQLDRFRGKHIGLIFQVSHFVSSLSVKENLLMAQYLAGEPKDGKKVEALLQDMGLADKFSQKPFRLSQGQQQRVAIARALVNKPKLILADEPTSSLDDSNCFRVIDILEQQAAEIEAALVIVTHDHRLTEKFPHQLLL